MRAAVMRDAEIVVDTVPDPEPRAGEVLVRTLTSGICGTDLHMREQAERRLRARQEAGSERTEPDVVMGHEYCAEIVDHGPGSERTLPVGTRVVAMPFVHHAKGRHTVGFSPLYPGGFGQAMVLEEALLLPVPNGLDSERATLTEPMAVGAHAVARSGLDAGDAALVFGCGPVGLAVIGALALADVEPIVAADFSPRRRELATVMGAHAVVDPRERPAIDVYAELAAARPAVLFECVGVPGMLAQMMSDAPVGSRLVVAGVCMEEDRIQPAIGINKELSIQFVMAYSAAEFAATLREIAEGRLDVAPLVTGRVGLDGVAQSFVELAHPDKHAKILVDPDG